MEHDSPATLDVYFEDCRFTDDELKEIYDTLNNVTRQAIVEAVAFPREDWGITFRERLGMINYLIRRKKDLQNHLEFKLGLVK